jgi:molybdenum cofactor guanylyltransferase
MSSRPPCVGAVLAGGRSSRLGGEPKAFTPLAGQAMIHHVLQRLRPQVDGVLLCVDEAEPRFAALGGTLVIDIVRSHRGPLTGLCSALRALETDATTQWLVLVPCDAPFLPHDLADRLLDAALAQATLVATAHYEGHAQPTFSAWHMDTLPAIEAAVLNRGQGGLMHMLDQLPHALVDWSPRQPPPFFNVNTPAERDLADNWLDRGRSED